VHAIRGDDITLYRRNEQCFCTAKVLSRPGRSWVIRVVDEPWRVVGHVRRPPKTGRNVEERAVSSTGRWRTAKTTHGISPPYFLTKCLSIQSGATLGSAGVSQQAFEHETGV
jgi:hypothetical protein